MSMYAEFMACFSPRVLNCISFQIKGRQEITAGSLREQLPKHLIKKSISPCHLQSFPH